MADPVSLRPAAAAAGSPLVDEGWTFARAVVDRDLLDRLRADLATAYQRCRQIQITNGIGDATDGTVHHLPCFERSFVDFLECGYGEAELSSFFGGPYIVNSYGGVLNLPGNLSYVGKVHRDLRTFSGDLPLMAQLLVMLDDFTEENGATYLLGRSHRMNAQPSDEEFFRGATRAIGPAGSIVVFNSNLWHAAGVNRSETPRRALTIVFTKPFMKQQLDYPRAIDRARVGALSPRLEQLLGYNARVPTSLDEWYQPPDKRLYKRDQG